MCKRTLRSLLVNYSVLVYGMKHVGHCFLEVTLMLPFLKAIYFDYCSIDTEKICAID